MNDTALDNLSPRELWDLMLELRGLADAEENRVVQAYTIAIEKELRHAGAGAVAPRSAGR
jgi:hypothetical protein